MNAFQCSDAHIGALVDAARHWDVHWFQPSTTGYANIDDLTRSWIAARDREPSRLGQQLAITNWLSVHAANPDLQAPEPVYQHVPRPVLPAVQILKAVRCYIDQACDTITWDDSEAANFCRELETAAIVRLPGWQEASWHIGDTTADTK